MYSMYKPTPLALLHLLFVVFLVLNCNSVYDAGAVDYHFDVICCTIAVAMVIMEKGIINKPVFLCIILYVIYQIPLLFNVASDYVVTYVFKYVVFVPCIIYLSQKPSFLNRTIRIFVEFIFVIAVVSLFFFVFSVLFDVIQPSGKYLLLWDPERYIDSYYGVFFTPSLTTDSFVHAKNSAIFAEAPVWAALVVIATVFELFIRQRTRTGHILVFYITLFSTLSDTSYIFICLSLMCLIYLQKNKIKNIVVKAAFNLFSVCIIVAGFFIVFSILKDKSEHGISFLLRADDLVISINVCLDHPLFGMGFGNETYRYDYASLERLSVDKTGGQSSDLAAMLGQGGLYFFLFYSYAIYKMCENIGNTKNKWVIFCLFFYVLSISRVGLTLLAFSMIFANIAPQSKKIISIRYLNG